MILFLSDVHAVFDVVNVQIRHAEETLGKPVEAVIVLGDMGIFESHLKDYFIRRRQRFERRLYFIEGNHEDFPVFPRLAKKYRHEFTHLPRSSVHQIDHRRFLCLGGAAYMDAAATPRHSVIEPRDIEAALLHPPGSVDMIISHDCPAFLGIPHTPGFEHYGIPGFSGGEQLLERFRPRYWFFGHHHKWFMRDTEPTCYHGLAESWKGYLVLDDAGSVRIVHHHVPLRRTFLQRVLRVLRF